MKNYAYELKKSLDSVYYGDIHTANEQKLRSALSDPDTFAVFQRQISDTKCEGIWPKDDANKVDQLIAISKKLSTFVLKYKDGDVAGEDPIQGYELEYARQLLIKTNLALDTAIKEITNPNAYQEMQTKEARDMLRKTIAEEKITTYIESDGISIKNVSTTEYRKEGPSEGDIEMAMRVPRDKANNAIKQNNNALLYAENTIKKLNARDADEEKHSRDSSASFSSRSTHSM